MEFQAGKPKGVEEMVSDFWKGFLAVSAIMALDSYGSLKLGFSQGRAYELRKTKDSDLTMSEFFDATYGKTDIYDGQIQVK